MKIGQLDNKAVLTPVVAERNTPAAKAGKPAQVEASAQVQLSSAASSLGETSSAEFDSAKVDRIAQAMRDGKFQVNPGAIADKLIANAKELLGSSSH